MFTGLIEAIGVVKRSESRGGDVRLQVSIVDFVNDEIKLGDSIALNGACMTVVGIDGDQYQFDVSRESLDHTKIGEWQVGQRINCERALLPTTRLGGHIVTGHIDGVATLQAVSDDGRSHRMQFSAPYDLKKYIAKKGSITLDGISLTVNSVEQERFDVNIIPHTFEVTNLSRIRPGDEVHIEVDLIARYLERMLTSSDSVESMSGVSIDLLQRNGFIES